MPVRAEADEGREPGGDNSVGRLLTLADGIFAIAMTLLALDLRLPGLSGHLSDAQLRHALSDHWRSYLAFVISFYVAGKFWGVHRRAMRSVETIDQRLVGSTLLVLLLVAALPFPASILATHGSAPTALMLYAAFNVVANLALLRLLAHTRRLASGLGSQAGVAPLELWADIGVFLVCIALARPLGGNAPFLLFLLAVAGRATDYYQRRRDAAAGWS